jgi:hypothetical protein
MQQRLQIRIVRREEEADKAPRIVHIGATAETEIRKQQHEQEKKWKSTGKETQETFYDANVGGSAESEIRKQQHEQEKKWRALVRKP